MSENAHPVDVHVGKRIRARRHIVGISQENLADSIGITFQQIQKYERGFNRVSASRLYEIARDLHAPVSYFFEGLEVTADGAPPGPRETALADLACAENGYEMAEIFAALDGKSRASLMSVARAIASAVGFKSAIKQLAA